MADIAILPTPDARFNEEVISKLEHLLEMARSGEIESFIAAAFKSNGGWTMVFSGQHETLQKIGVLETMKADLLETMKV